MSVEELKKALENVPEDYEVRPFLHDGRDGCDIIIRCKKGMVNHELRSVFFDCDPDRED